MQTLKAAVPAAVFAGPAAIVARPYPSTNLQGKHSIAGLPEFSTSRACHFV